MAYKDVSFAISPISLGTVPEHKKRKVKSIIVDNPSSVYNVFWFHDVFTPTASNGTASPTAQTKTWFKLTVAAGTVSKNFSERDLSGIALLGAVDVSANVADASGNIAFNFIDE